MKDTELRGIVLQQFYERRKQGTVSINGKGGVKFENPAAMDVLDVLRICDQLSHAGLIEFEGVLDASAGHLVQGWGKITGNGVDVIEREAASPIPIHVFDQSQHHQTINISGTQGGVQVGGANSRFDQNIAQDIEKLISAINGSTVNDEAKKEAKSKLAAFLGSEVVQGLLGAGAKALIKACCE